MTSQQSFLIFQFDFVYSFFKKQIYEMLKLVRFTILSDTKLRYFTPIVMGYLKNTQIYLNQLKY